MELKKKYAKVLKEYEAKNYEEALKQLNKVRAKEKDTYYIEAAIYRELKNYVKEYRALTKLLPILPPSSPDYGEFINNLALNYSNLGLVDEAVKLHFQIMNTTKNKDVLYEVTRSLCFNICLKEDASIADFQAIYEKYRTCFTSTPFPRRFYNHDKIRVGFLSGNFYNHVGIKWSWALLTKLDNASFEVYAYSNSDIQDDITKRLQEAIKNWRDIRDMTDEAAAKLIQDDEIDILFDLDMTTANNRLGVVAYRPATVQISAIGFASSTGLKTVDYFVTDEHCLGNSAPYFTEDFIVMSNTHICYQQFDEEKLLPAPEPPCLKNGYVTFGTFNQYRKITDSMLTVWKRILDAVPNSRLLLKDRRTLNTEDGREFVGERLKRFGFNLKLVELRGNSDKHPLDYDDMDIALDTFPYTGVTTTIEALLMGVPVVSLYGDRHATRCGLSILQNIGLAPLAVDSYDEYFNMALVLANDWKLLSVLKKTLRAQVKKSPLMNATAYVREMEQVFIEILDAARNAE